MHITVSTNGISNCKKEEDILTVIRTILGKYLFGPMKDEVTGRRSK